MKNSNCGLRVVCLGTMLAMLPACASSGKKTEIRTDHEAVVTVESIDVPNRLVTVREAAGDTATFYVDQSIRSFPQAKVGDKVRIRYQESIAVQMAKPGEAGPRATLKEETTKPGSGAASGSARSELTAVVKIEKVNKSGTSVTFTGPRGRRTIQVVRPEMQKFAKSLRPGDEVEVAYSEALALSLEPVKH